MSDFEPQVYEMPTDTRYTYFSRFRDILPPYIWQQLMGITPQQRRAFLLQQRYLTPLTFNYSLLQFFSQFSVNVMILHLVKVFWDYKGNDDPISFFLIFAALIGAYAMFRITTAKNTSTIREEVIYRSVVDSLALFFSIIVVFNINGYWMRFF